MIVRGALVYTGEHKFIPKNLYIIGERIVEEAVYGRPEPGETVVDGTGLYALPGLVDIHLHGAAGYDCCDGDPKGLAEIAKFEADNGILAFCPATMSWGEEVLNRVADAAKAYRASRDGDETEWGADLAGIHMEGPFVNPNRAGAQNPRYLTSPDLELFDRLQERCGGLIRLLSLAPELEGALDFIETRSGRTAISLAHTEADYETAAAAFERGACHMTHLYNAMPGIGHRAPGPIPAALECGATAELICDGVHVHPATVRFTFRVFGADRVVLVSDSMRACGMPEGTYLLGGQRVKVRGRRAALAEDGSVIAGSVTHLFDCVRRAVREMGVPLEDALRAASENPARVIGLDGDYGSLEPGHLANIVLTDENLGIRRIIRRGRERAEIRCEGEGDGL